MRSVVTAVMLGGCGGSSVGDLGGEMFTFDVADALRVETDSGRIEVTDGADDVYMVEVLPGSGADSFTDRVEDGTLYLESTCGGGDLGCGVGFVIQVPAGQVFDVETSSGEVTVGSGLTGVGAAQTATADVTGDGLGAMDFSVLTGSGVQRVTFADTPVAVNLDTGSADIELTLPSGGYALNLDGPTDITQSGVTDDPQGPPVRCQSGTGSIRVTGS